MKSATKTHVGWLSAESAALYMDFTTADGSPDLRRFYDWRVRMKVKTHRTGRLMRFRQVDLDACVDAERPSVDASPRLVVSR